MGVGWGGATLRRILHQGGQAAMPAIVLPKEREQGEGKNSVKTFSINHKF